MICPRCASANNPSEKFCTVCSSPLAQPGGFPPQQGGFPPPPQGGYGYGPPPGYDPNAYGQMPPGQGMQGNMGQQGMGQQGMGQQGMGQQGMGGGMGQQGMGQQGMGGGMGQQGMGQQGMGQQGMGGGMMPPQPDYNQQFANQFPPQPFPPPDPYGATPGGGYGSPAADPFSATNFQQPAQPPTNAMTPFPPQPVAAPPPPPPPAPAPDARPSPGASGGKRRPLAGFLVSFQDDTNGRFWPIYQGRNLIGRAETGQEVDVPIGHGTTSTNHATLEAENGRLVLSDLGSTNGTFHNEEAIGFQGRRELRDGDKVRFGGFSVIVINIAARA